jgi:hypothetical protein
MKFRAMMFPFSCLAIVLATGCGGGGGGGGDDLGANIPNALITIDSGNGQDVAGAVNEAANGSTEVTDIIGIASVSPSAGGPQGATQVGELLADRVIETMSSPLPESDGIAAAVQTSTDPCEVSGTVTTTINDANNNGVMDAGDSATFRSNECLDSSGTRVDGTFSVVVNTAIGNVGDDFSSWTLNASLDVDRLSITEAGTTSVVDGGITIDAVYDHLTPQTNLRISGSSLVFIEGSRGDRLSNFDIQIEEDASAGPGAEMCTTTFDFDLASTELDGRVMVRTDPANPFVGNCNGDPVQGMATVNGKDNTLLEFEVTGPDSIELRIDGNGDGDFADVPDPDNVITVTWATL